MPRRRKVDRWAMLPDQTAPVAFVLVGTPRSKGNSRVPDGNGSRRTFPSKAYRDWLRAAAAQVPAIRGSLNFRGRFNGPVLVTATWFVSRRGAVPDFDNLEKGLGDFLERVGFVKNDRNIKWGPCERFRADEKGPRTEVRIEVRQLASEAA